MHGTNKESRCGVSCRLPGTGYEGSYYGILCARERGHEGDHVCTLMTAKPEAVVSWR